MPVTILSDSKTVPRPGQFPVYDPASGEALAAGSVSVNDIHGSDLQCPYGGVRASGLGREQSHEALLEYRETKTIHLDMAERNRGGYRMVH